MVAKVLVYDYSLLAGYVTSIGLKHVLDMSCKCISIPVILKFKALHQNPPTAILKLLKYSLNF